MLKRSGILVKAVLLLGLVFALFLYPPGSSTCLPGFVALATSDDDTYDTFDTFEQFEQMDAAEFNDLIERAKACIGDWDFDCAEKKLEEAKRYITKKEDNATIASLKKFAAFESLLAKSSKCAKDWDFDCAVEKLKDAKEYAEANLGGYGLYVDVSVLEDRLKTVADYIEEQHNQWEEAARRNPDIILTRSYEVSDGQVVSAEVWAAGQMVMSADVLIEWYNPSINGYEIALYVNINNKDHPTASAILSSIPRLLCNLYVYGPGYYTNELRCGGYKLGSTEGYERLNYPLERLVRDVVTFYYQSKN